VAAVKQLVEKVTPIDDKHVADDWRALARRAQNEPDNDKMIELIQQVIVKFNEEKSAHSVRRPRTESGCVQNLQNVRRIASLLQPSAIDLHPVKEESPNDEPATKIGANWHGKIQEEKDPQKMIELVQQLIAKFDEQQALKTSPPKPDAQNRPRSPQA